MFQAKKAVRVAVLVLVLSAGLQGAAMAQDGSLMHELDPNGDGIITKAAAQHALETEFAKMDTNHDGVLSKDEFVAAGMALFKQFDTNGDGQVTRAELRARFLSRWSGHAPDGQ